MLHENNQYVQNFIPGFKGTEEQAVIGRGKVIPDVCMTIRNGGQPKLGANLEIGGQILCTIYSQNTFSPSYQLSSNLPAPTLLTVPDPSPP